SPAQGWGPVLFRLVMSRGCVGENARTWGGRSAGRGRGGRRSGGAGGGGGGPGGGGGAGGGGGGGGGSERRAGVRAREVRGEGAGGGGFEALDGGADGELWTAKRI